MSASSNSSTGWSSQLSKMVTVAGVGTLGQSTVRSGGRADEKFGALWSVTVMVNTNRESLPWSSVASQFSVTTVPAGRVSPSWYWPVMLSTVSVTVAPMADCTVRESGCRARMASQLLSAASRAGPLNSKRNCCARAGSQAAATHRMGRR